MFFFVENGNDLKFVIAGNAKDVVHMRFGMYRAFFAYEFEIF
jgi:hypothetical protein